MKLNTLRDVYKTFETAEDRAAKILAQSSSDPATQNNITPFRALVDLLYPNPAGAFHSGEDLWQKLQEIFAAKSDNAADDNSKKLKEFLVESVRVYYTTFTGDKSSLEENIKDFYTKNGRKSAYIGWSRNRDENGSNYREATLRDMVLPPNISAVDSSALAATSLMYILVDTPVIDLKIRRANEAEVFLNYMPSTVTSQLVPYLSAEFTLNRKVKGSNPGRQLDTMGQLRFLLGDPSSNGNDGLGSTDKQIYDALNTTKLNAPGDLTTRERIQKSLKIRNKLVARLVAAPNTNENRVTGTRTSSTGMDIFTMPQTLVNLDYRQDQNPRYNPVLNPVLPFGTITGVSINIAPSTGVMSFKTATLNIKIFDRSRLVEIADFINPRLYKSVTVWLTYGWRAPEFSRSEASSAQTYYDFINQNMLVREAFGVKNSGMTIESDGTVSLTISLYTLGGINILQAKDSLSNEYEDLEARLGENLARLAELAKSLGLQAFLDVGQEVRGAQLIGAAMRGDLIGLDFTTLEQELLAIKKSLEGSSDPQAAEFISLLTDIYAKSGSGQAAVAKGKSTSQKLGVLEDMEAVARQLTNIRFDGLKDAVDLFGEDNTPTGKYKDSEKERISPLSRMFKSFKNNQESKPKNSATADVSAQNEGGRTLAEDTQVAHRQFGPFGTCSFGRVFAYYFGQVATALSKSEIIDEFQVVFYKLNDLAGSVAGINIAEFPIEIAALERAYADRVNKQKGENMSFNLFLEVVRQSQFSDMRSLAYGFRDFYQEDRKTNQLVPIPNTQEELSQRLLMNGNRGGPFTIPAIDFYIEAGYAHGETKVYTDLLDAINFFSARPTSTGVPGSLKRILRIHIYDKASRPNKTVAQMLAGNPAGTYVELNDTYLQGQVPINPDPKSAQNVPQQALDAVRNNETLQAARGNKEVPTSTIVTQISEAVNSVVGGTFQSDKALRVHNFKDASGKNASFEKVKREIAFRVPTITLGSNGSTVTSVSYSTNQDALLSTIMMLRNPQNATNPSKPNGSAEGDLPLRVIPGALSVNTLGCPIVEYMQQFFVDLGTGTTVDNLYNITGLTHNMSPGKFETQIKFTFEDAYGKYEGAQSLIDGFTSKLSYMKTQQENGKDKKKPGGK